MANDVDIQCIIDGCQRGEAQWQRALYERYSARFYALCRRYTGDDEIAKDLLIDGFVSIFDSIDQYRGTGVFEAWMNRIFVRATVRRLMQRQRNRVQLSEESVLEHLQVRQESLFDLRNTLDIAMECLDAEQRTTFNLVAVEGYSFTEVAHMTNRSVSAVKHRYYQARDTMKRILGEIEI